MSGVLTSFALRPHLEKVRKRTALIVGVISLPIGAFLFGFFLSVAQWAMLDRDFSPFSCGVEYMVFSMITYLTIALVPLSVVTSFLLRAVIDFGGRHENTA